MLFVIIFLTTMIVVSFSIPPIIKVSFQKRLFDDPSESRKVHKRIIPNFGGIAIFTSFLFASALFIPSNLLPQANILMAGGVILFMTGLKDDVVGLSPLIKFVAQFTVAFIVAIGADLRIENLNGIFGIYELNYYASVTLTVFFIVGIVNSFNLIDGIDGLAASLGILITLLYAFLFYKSGDLGWAYMSIALTGALLGFLFFNVTPAKIFMGDSGSLMIGFIISTLSLKFANVDFTNGLIFNELHINSSLGLIVAILIIPIFDTLRVFTLRILKNTSPFTADSNHLHHRLLFLGLSHMQSTLILTVFNVLFIIMALALQDLSDGLLIGAVVMTILAVNGIFSIYIEYYKRSLFSPKANVHIEEVLLSDTQISEQDGRSFGEKVLEKISEN